MALTAGTIRLLILEDSADDAELNVLELTKVGLDVSWKRVQSAAELRAALSTETWDVILSDHTMPGFNAASGLEIARGFDADIPFIVISGSLGEERAVAMLQAGANDYLLKGSLFRLGHAVERALEETRARRAHRRAREKASLLATIVSTTDDAIISKALDGTITSWNPGAERMFGWTEADAIDRPISIIVPADKVDEFANAISRLQPDRRPQRFDTVRIRRDGTRVDVALVLSPLLDASSKLLGYSTVARDITEQLAAQQAINRGRDSLEEAQAIAHVGSWTSNDHVAWSRECYRIFDVPEGTAVTMSSFFDSVHPADLERVRAARQDALDGTHRSTSAIE